MTTESFDRRIAALSARQHGVVSRDQVLHCGVSKGVIQTRVRSGRWERLHPSVYRVAGAPSSWHQQLMAAYLACGGRAAVSHLAAAPLWTLAGFALGLVELSVPANTGRCRGVKIHRVLLAAVDVTVLNRIPVTTVARTLIDIAGVADPDAVAEALDDALRRKLVSRSRLRWRLEELGRSGRPGIRLMRSLLAARRSGESVPQSVFETRLLRLIEGGDLPRPVLQHEVRAGAKLVAVPDFAYPEVRLAVEADGYGWHASRAQWERDLARRNALMALGWRIVHVTWNDLTRRPSQTVRRITEALSAPELPGSAPGFTDG